MKPAVDGLPVVGSNSKELGVRVPPNPSPDVDLDDREFIVQNGRGMSVAENWRHLLPHLIPKRLKPLSPGAAGPNSIACFKMGAGAFAACAVNIDLYLALKPGTLQHGNIVPARAVHRDQFQASLAATRSEWSIDEA